MVNKKVVPESTVYCHLTTIQDLESNPVNLETRNIIALFKAQFAKPWNLTIKPWVKSVYRKQKKLSRQRMKNQNPLSQQNTVKDSLIQSSLESAELMAGDFVLVKSREDIEGTLDAFHELKGCAFLEPMYEYCGTKQRVYTKVERFLDERNFKVRSSKGLYFLENLQCTGTAVFGRCDRRCYYFWRTEWLEKIDSFASMGE